MPIHSKHTEQWSLGIETRDLYFWVAYLHDLDNHPDLGQTSLNGVNGPCLKRLNGSSNDSTTRFQMPKFCIKFSCVYEKTDRIIGTLKNGCLMIRTS